MLSYLSIVTRNSSNVDKLKFIIKSALKIKNAT